MTGQQSAFPAALFRAGDVQARRVLGCVERMGMDDPQGHRERGMVAEHDIALDLIAETLN